MAEDKKIEYEMDFTNLTKQDILYSMSIAMQDDSRLKTYPIHYEIVMKLLAKIGQEPLKKKWGNKTEENLRKLRKLSPYVSNINFYLSNLNPEKVKNEENITDSRFVQARKSFAVIVFHLDVLYEALYSLIDASTIKTLSIPAEYFTDRKRQYGREVQYES